MRLVTSATRAAVLATMAIGMAGFAPPPGPNIFVLTIDAAKQGRLKGDGPRGILASGLSYQVASPRDAATGLPTGKRQFSPVVITKEWGASSPQLYSALAANEVLKTVQIDRYRTT